MMNTTKALELALEALEIAEKHLAYVEIFEAITAIKQALNTATPLAAPEFGLTWERFNALEAEIATLQVEWQASLKDIQRLSALVRAQQITIDKLEASFVQQETEDLYELAVKADNGGQP